MKLKEKIKKEIDSMPEEYLAQLERYLEGIKSRETKYKNIKTLNLKGKFDNLNLRQIAYEQQATCLGLN